MAKDRLHELKQTASSFQVRGIVTGTKSKRFYSSGTGKNGGQWNAVEFGVKIAENKSVFIKLNGFPRPEVFYYKRGENGAKGTTQKVAWKDRKKSPGNGYRLIGVNITTGQDENEKNINETFTEYDAVEWIHSNLKDGDSVFVKGNIVFSSYTDKNGEIRKRIELVPTQISAASEVKDEESCEFENILVFSGIDKEEDESGKATGRFVLSGYSIGYNTVETVSFIIDEEHAKLANNLRKKMKPGYSIKIFGRVNVINDISTVESADDGWGESSPMERVNTPVRREYVIYRADPNSIDTEEYSEKDIAAALRKIKAAKEAAKNFGEKVSSVSESTASDDWGDGDDDEDVPWD